MGSLYLYSTLRKPFNGGKWAYITTTSCHNIISMRQLINRMPEEVRIIIFVSINPICNSTIVGKLLSSNYGLRVLAERKDICKKKESQGNDKV